MFLGVVSLTSLALVFHRTVSANASYKLRSPFSSTEDVLVKKNVGNNSSRMEGKSKDVVVEKNDGNITAACRLPDLDPFHSSVVNFMKDLGKLRCDGVSYSSFENNVLRVEGEGIVAAQYTKIQRTPGKDFDVVLSDPVKVQNTSDQQGELFSQLILLLPITNGKGG